MTTQMEIGPAEVQPKKRRRRRSDRAWEFLVAAKAWCLAHADRLARMHVFERDGEFFMYIVPKTMPYDPELTDWHAQFTIDLWVEHRIPAHGQQIPDTPHEDLSAFFDTTNVFTLTPV